MIAVFVYVAAQVGLYFLFTATPLFADILPDAPKTPLLWICIAHAVAFGLFLRGPVAALVLIAGSPWLFGLFTGDRALGAVATAAIAAAGCFAIAVQARVDTGDNRRRLTALPIVVLMLALGGLSTKLIFGGPRTYHAASGMLAVFAIPLGLAIASAAYDSARHTALAFGLAALAFGALASAQIASVEANMLVALAGDPPSRAGLVLASLQQRAPLIRHRTIVLSLMALVATAGGVWAWLKTSRPNPPMVALVTGLLALPVIADLRIGTIEPPRAETSGQPSDVFEKIALEEIRAIDPSWVGFATTATRSRSGS